MAFRMWKPAQETAVVPGRAQKAESEPRRSKSVDSEGLRWSWPVSPDGPCDGLLVIGGAVANGDDAGRKAFVAKAAVRDRQGTPVRLGKTDLARRRYLAGGTREEPQEFKIVFPATPEATDVTLVLAPWVADELPELIDGPSIYTVKTRLESDVIGDNYYLVAIEIETLAQISQKAFICTVRYWDATGEALVPPYPDLGTTKEGSAGYVYISGASHSGCVRFEHLVLTPPAAALMEIKVARWQAREQPICRRLDISWIAPSPEQQLERMQTELAGFIADTARDNRNSIIVLTTTTRPIASANRVNRSDSIASILAKAGHAVIYVYYRFNAREALPPRRPNLIQIPNDLFAVLAEDIAALDLSFRLAIFSVPDHRSAQQIGLFARMNWFTIYEARDDWEEFAAAGVGKWYHPVFERFLCEQADRVVTVSPQLGQKMVLLGADEEKVSVVPNATTAEFVGLGRPHREARLRRDPGPGGNTTIGYFGHLTAAWFDWDLVVASAVRNPARRYDLIGFGAPRDLPLPPNVQVREAVPPLELPEATAEWSVAVIPFRPSALAAAVDPLKLYDYLALGLPVVSVEMSRVSRYQRVETYSRAEDFEEAIDRALNQPSLSEADMAEYESELSHVTWDSRMTEILSLTGRIVRD